MAGVANRPVIEVCDSSWHPLGELADWDQLTTVHRVCDVGTGAVDAAATPANRALIERGSTVLVSVAGVVRQAGLISQFGEDEQSQQVLKLSWVDPLAYLGAERAFPNPGTATGQGPEEFDRRQGYASTVILGFVAANVGPAARSERRAPGLTVGVDVLAGQYLTAAVEARWDNLLDVCRNAAIPNGVVFSVSTVDRAHTFGVRPVRDLSADVVFSRRLNNLGAGSWSVKAPAATAVIALGKGEGPARTVVVVTSPESLVQEASWGRRFTYVHESSSADTESLIAEARRQLSEKGETVEASYQVLDGTFTFGVDYGAGDLVAVHPDGLSEPVVKPVREVTESWSVAAGYRVVPVVGDYQATSSTGQAFKTRELIRTVDALKRRA